MKNSDFCRFNQKIECYHHDCDECGWNPECARRRKFTRRLREVSTIGSIQGEACRFVPNLWKRKEIENGYY